MTNPSWFAQGCPDLCAFHAESPEFQEDSSPGCTGKADHTEFFPQPARKKSCSKVVIFLSPPVTHAKLIYVQLFSLKRVTEVSEVAVYVSFAAAVVRWGKISSESGPSFPSPSGILLITSPPCLGQWRECGDCWRNCKHNFFGVLSQHQML